MRRAPDPLERRYQRLCEIPSDINEHLPRLRELASECEHVTEFGMRHGVSTTALLAGQPQTLISWDLHPAVLVSMTVGELLAEGSIYGIHEGRTRLEPRIGDTLKITIEPTEMLFIDTWHTHDQLLAELTRHASPRHESGRCECFVRKYLVFHDTVTFGHKGEDGREPGLRKAIRTFQKEIAFPLWRLVEDRQNNNGLAVLEHI